MQTTKLTVKFFLVMVLFVSMANADGHIGGGGLADDGHIGGGGRTCSEQEQDDTGNCPDTNTSGDDDEGDGFANSIFVAVKEYLANLLG